MKLQAFVSDHTHYQYIHTNQFKTRVLTIRFFVDMTGENITARNLMLAMLRAKNQAHPSRKQLNKHLETLYDTIFVTQAFKYGTKHVNQLTLVVIDDHYTLEKQLFEDGLALMRDTLYHPDFDDKTLAEEKQFLKDFFKSEYTNKTRFAHKQYHKHLMAEHPYNAHPYGDEALIDTITLDQIVKSYHSMMTTNQVYISVVGDFDDQAVHAQLLKHLPLKSMPNDNPILHRHRFSPMPPVKEIHEVTQNRVFMTLKSDVFFRDEDYFTMLVFNALFGEGSDALLFQTVRERHALAYYVSSSFSPFSGLITMVSAMDKANIEKGKNMMMACLSLIQNGSFTDEDLDLAKTHLISQFKQSYDSSGALANKALRSVLFDLPFKEDSMIRAILDVPKIAITSLANRLELIFTYELGGGPADENQNL